MLLVGPVGVGKTATLHALSALLDEQEQPHAIIDLDWLAWATLPAAGPTVPELLVVNLAAVWETFQAAGIERIAVARALHSRDEVAAVCRALVGCDVCVIELSAPPNDLRRRIRQRDTGVELDEHLAAIDAYERTDRVGHADAVIPSADASPAQVARAALDIAGW